MEMDVQEGETRRRQGRIEQNSWYVIFVFTGVVMLLAEHDKHFMQRMTI